MPRTSSRSTAKKPAKKQPAKKQPAAKSKIIYHTDDGIPIVNATMAQIRKGVSGGAAGRLVRIPQVAERSKFYAEAAEVIGERESLALPYHGGRMWRCEIKVSDEDGAYGDNRKGKGKNGNDDDENSPKKKSNYKSLTPLFRWYRGSLILATLPYILEDIVEVECKIPGKKRWANGLSDDELDSSDEEWDDEKYQVEPSKKMTMEISALTASAYEDSSHPMPHISRSWISPDLQRFPSRKSAIAHVDTLVKQDLLIDRTLYGYGHNGVRLRPVKPTRKVALEAGMARFLRDGLWVVGQEEMWIEKRRDVLVQKQEKRLLQSEEQSDEGPTASDALEKEDDKTALLQSEEQSDEGPASEKKGDETETVAKRVDKNAIAAPASASEEKGDKTATAKKSGDWSDNAKAAARAAAGYVHPEFDAPYADQHMENVKAIARAAAGYVHPDELDSKPAAASSTTCDDDDAKVVVSPAESDASTEGTTKNPENNNVIVKRSPHGTKPPPAFTPSTHYRLNEDQIDLCFAACIDHYEKVMHTVKARSLHHELADGFDVLRERGRGRYDMELDNFDTEAFSFLTDPKKASWMPIVHKILGDDASLVHKGCFLSLPGSETQVYHQDGVHLNKKTHKPCYAINVFIPLVDYDMTNGPTEFCLGTHYLDYENFVKENVYTPCVTAGTPIMFDYRLGHRGLRNFSQGVRPVLYLTYSSVASGKEFRDSVNFSRKRYHKLGDFAEKPLSREERAQKRRRQEK
mmetsp:Transcript_26730/g.46450  ORF Transcript_26730/g.46450 Transcript_26730/m.46450 type:complete len:747 (+) Transcript_26730:173-2413(+)|eukprot:CAMPEP_0201867118 /NCGR_PEP_ID=MMETSP0902-20130614/1474_1 /ASSEMBLY_ACC=CAM_ASM_000551 /TAXON_ID=420261 /ORGANISM="Thalassiosira antarctica, Strain CCMP982" /LENGTH=746 /DNA_ID=CAMNT_0048392235 /DNA_START=167 /DNA_END=2407 /DNA_ORIENTATION=+